MTFRDSISWILGKLGALVLLALVICCSPFAIIWMWLDFRRLKRTALEVEPMRPNEHPNVIGKTIIFIVLPFIVIIGLCIGLFKSSNDEDEIIW